VPIRLILVWAVVALFVATLLIIVFGGNARETPELAYSAMLEHVDAGEATQARTRGNRLFLTLDDGQEFVVHVPEGAMPETVDRLYAADVEITASPSGPTLREVVLGLLPMLLLLAAWYFFFRKLQPKGQDRGRWPD
jgi:ATP-dependent Zn protease